MEHDAYIEMADAEIAHWWFQGRRQILASDIARILELGSGTGGNFDMLRRFGSVTAMEANATARRISLQKSSGAVTVMAGTLPREIPVFDNKFDLICLFDVLEHVEEDEETLAVIKDLLAEGGKIVLTVPALAKLWGPHDERVHHKRRYGQKELNAKLRRAGFRIAKLS